MESNDKVKFRLRNISLMLLAVSLAVTLLDTMLVQTQNSQVFAQPSKNKTLSNGVIKRGNSKNSDNKKDDLSTAQSTSHHPFGKNLVNSEHHQVSYSKFNKSTKADVLNSNPFSSSQGTVTANFYDLGSPHVIYDKLTFQIVSYNDGCTGIFDYEDCIITEGEYVQFDIVCKDYPCWAGTDLSGLPSNVQLTTKSISWNGGVSPGLYRIDVYILYKNACQEPPGEDQVCEDVAETSIYFTVVGGQNNPPVPVLNVLPSNTVEPGTFVTLDGSGSSDPDGDEIVSYHWKQNFVGSEGPVTLNNALTSTATFIAPVVQTDTDFVFQLTVEDSKGAIGEGTIHVTVKAASCQNPTNPSFLSSLSQSSVSSQAVNCPPVAVGTAKEDKTGVYIVFDGKHSYDPDGDKVVEYRWLQFDNSGIKADIRGRADDPNPYFVEPKVEKPTELAFVLIVKDSLGAQSINNPVIKITINPCTLAEKAKVQALKFAFLHEIEAGTLFNKPVAAETIDLWITGDGAKQFPENNPRILANSWIRSASEIQTAQVGLHKLFEKTGKDQLNPTLPGNLEDYIRGVPNDGNHYTFKSDKVYDIRSSTSAFTDYNIAIGGSKILAHGEFDVTKDKNGDISVVGSVKYSFLDRFDWNKGTVFPLLSKILKSIPRDSRYFVNDADTINLLEKCGDAAPFWSAGHWSQVLAGTGSSAGQGFNVQYSWTDVK